MGGRYDQLGFEFGADLPAIGFACEIESLVKAADNLESMDRYPIDVKIIYEDSRLKQAIEMAEQLREQDYRVLSITKLERSSQSRSVGISMQIIGRRKYDSIWTKRTPVYNAGRA